LVFCTPTGLGLSVITVKHYLNDIFLATGVRSRGQLVALTARFMDPPT
jgi:DNA-binding CsgD family transcriptional regulator